MYSKREIPLQKLSNMRLSHFTTDDRSVCLGFEFLCGIATTCKSEVWNVMPCRTGTLSDNTAVLQFAGSRSPPQVWTFTTFIIYKNFYIKKLTVYTWPLSGLASYSTLCLIFLSFCYNSSSVTSTIVNLTATNLKLLIFQLSKFHKHLFFYSGETGIIHFTEGTRCYTRLAQPVARECYVVRGNIRTNNRILTFPMAKPRQCTKTILNTKHYGGILYVTSLIYCMKMC